MGHGDLNLLADLKRIARPIWKAMISDVDTLDAKPYMVADSMRSLVLFFDPIYHGQP